MCLPNQLGPSPSSTQLEGQLVSTTTRPEPRRRLAGTSTHLDLDALPVHAGRHGLVGRKCAAAAALLRAPRGHRVSAVREADLLRPASRHSLYIEGGNAFAVQYIPYSLIMP
jgi:hypothetical protein